MTIHLIIALVGFAALVVVPGLDPRPRLRGVWLGGILSLGLALGFPAQGAWLASGWVGFAIINALGPAVAWLRAPSWRLVALLRLSAPLHLVVGAVWACLAFAGVSLDGYPWIITALTAAHFHFAGFAAAHLAANSIERTGTGQVGGGLLLGGVPALAIGFMVHPALKLGAAVAIAVGMISVAIATLRRIDRFGAGRRWIIASWGAIVASMALSVAYAIGEYTGAWWLKIPDMAWTHGVLNALVFAGCGVIGWRKERA